MLRGQDDPGFYPCFWHTGHNPDKVQYKLSIGMGNDRKVRKYALRYFFGKFYVELVVVILFFHKTKLMVNAGNQKKPG